MGGHWIQSEARNVHTKKKKKKKERKKEEEIYVVSSAQLLTLLSLVFGLGYLGDLIAWVYSLGMVYVTEK